MAHTITSYDTVEAITAIGHLDPEVSQVLSDTPLYVIPLSLLSFSDLSALRPAQAFAESALSTIGKHPSIRETEISIPLRDGHINPAWVFTPSTVLLSQHQSSENETEIKTPIIILIHGGGFILGSPMQLAPLARGLTHLYHITVITITHQLAPEHKFPIPAQDIWDNTVWIVANTAPKAQIHFPGNEAAAIPGNLTHGFILGGQSAGANLASVAAQRSIREPLATALTGL